MNDGAVHYRVPYYTRVISYVVLVSLAAFLTLGIIHATEAALETGSILRGIGALIMTAALIGGTRAAIALLTVQVIDDEVSCFLGRKRSRLSLNKDSILIDRDNVLEIRNANKRIVLAIVKNSRTERLRIYLEDRIATIKAGDGLLRQHP